MPYTISPAARLDLEQASDYGDAVFGVSETNRYFHELDKLFETIAEFPELARERRDYLPPVRIHRHRRHYVIYAIQPDGIRIVRVLRVEVDLDRYLRRTS